MNLVKSIAALILTFVITQSFAQEIERKKVQYSVFAEGGMIFNSVGTKHYSSDIRGEEYMLASVTDFQSLGVEVRHDMKNRLSLFGSAGIGRYNYKIPVRGDVMDYPINPPYLSFRTNRRLGKALYYLDPAIGVNLYLHKSKNNSFSLDLGLSYPIFITRLYSDSFGVIFRSEIIDTSGSVINHEGRVYNDIGAPWSNRLLAGKIGFTYRYHSDRFIGKLGFSIFANRVLVNAASPNMRIEYLDLTNDRLWGNEVNKLSYTRLGFRISYNF